MATVSNTPRPGYVWDATDNVWYPIGVGGHGHPDYITQATAVNPTIIDAKGDIITATAADTPARLAVGNNGETLVADSSTSTGLRYQVAKSVNHIINGGMDIWQRGISFASAASLQYTTDRFQFLRAGSVAGGTLSRQNTSDTTNLPNIQYCAKVQRDSGNTSTAVTYFASSLESQETRQLQGQAVVLSFYARKGADYSAASSGLGVEIISGTGTDQNIFSGFTGQASIASSVTLTTTWKRFTATATVPSTATQLCVLFPFTPVGTAGANDYYEITGVQLELGTVPTPFQRSGGTIQGETSACQRYYVRLGANSGAVAGAYSTYGNGYSTSTTDASIVIPLPTTMRVAPTVCEFSNVAIQDFNTVVIAVSNVTINSAFMSPTAAVVAATTSGATAFRGCKLSNNNNTAGYVGFSAEL